MAFFITIEGADGVGKTTVSEKLAEKLNLTLLRTPPAPFNDKALRAIIEGEGSTLTKYFYYRTACQIASDRIKKSIAEGQGIISDRYIKSTQVYRSVTNPELEKIFEETDLIMPDFEILLTASPEVRLERVNERPDAGAIANELDVEFQNKIQDKFLEHNMYVIDTSNNTVDETVSQILEYISSKPAPKIENNSPKI